MAASSAKRIVGWDLGGAHVKAACIDIATERLLHIDQQACPLWRGLDELEPVVDAMLEQYAGAAHAVTMTGELVDAFATRDQGVRELVSFMDERLTGSTLLYYAGRSGFLCARNARTASVDVASANWLASGRLAARRVEEGLFVDMGSTTTDFLLFSGGEVRVQGFDDHARQRYEELVYSGVVRTPLMAIADRAPLSGEWISLAAEHFATTADVYRLLDVLPAHADLHAAADGGLKTKTGSARRLARMLCCDAQEADVDAWCQVAGWFAEQQLQRLHSAASRQLSRDLIATDAPIVGAGVGRFVAQRLAVRLDRPYLDFSDFFDGGSADGVDVADCAPAVAVAYLAREYLLAD